MGDRYTFWFDDASKLFKFWTMTDREREKSIWDPKKKKNSWAKKDEFSF